MGYPTLKQMKKRTVKIKKQLLEMDFSFDDIKEFDESCLQEAQIQATLPKCICKDPNQCETWCTAKARFAMNPPTECAHV